MSSSRNRKLIPGIRSITERLSRFSVGSRSDWLSGLIEVAKATEKAGDFAPFPYIKGAAGAIVLLLQNFEVSLPVCGPRRTFVSSP
jgi:hypothetical protein